MKTIFTLMVGLVGCCLLYSCDRDRDDDFDNTYALTARLDPAQTNDTDTEVVELYIFDSHKGLISTLKGTLNDEIDIKIAPNERLTVVALICTQGSPEKVFANGTLINEAFFTLANNTFGNSVTALSPPTVWMGRVTMQGAECDGGGEKEYTVWLKRKVASLSIVTRNLQSALSTTDIDFTYLVRSTHSVLNFDGSYTGRRVGYTPSSHFVPTNGVFLAPKFNTFPIADAQAFFIDIYKAGVLIKTFGLDSNQNTLLLQDGKHTLVWLDFHGDGGGVDVGNISIICKVLDWDATLQVEQF